MRKHLLLLVLAASFVVAQEMPAADSMPQAFVASSYVKARLPLVKLRMPCSKCAVSDSYDLGNVVGSTPVVMVWLRPGPDLDSTARFLSDAASTHPELVYLVAIADTQASFLASLKQLGLDLTALADPGRARLALPERFGRPALVSLNADAEVVWTYSLLSRSSLEEAASALSRESMVVDPVCQMKISKNGAAAQWDYKGTTYCFCHSNCLKLFKQNPNKYLTE